MSAGTGDLNMVEQIVCMPISLTFSPHAFNSYTSFSPLFDPFSPKQQYLKNSVPTRLKFYLFAQSKLIKDLSDPLSNMMLTSAPAILALTTCMTVVMLSDF